jgi:hypothetical protein
LELYTPIKPGYLFKKLSIDDNYLFDKISKQNLEATVSSIGERYRLEGYDMKTLRTKAGVSNSIKERVFILKNVEIHAGHITLEIFFKFVSYLGYTEGSTGWLIKTHYAT